MHGPWAASCVRQRAGRKFKVLEPWKFGKAQDRLQDASQFVKRSYGNTTTPSTAEPSSRFRANPSGQQIAESKRRWPLGSVARGQLTRDDVLAVR